MSPADILRMIRTAAIKIQEAISIGDYEFAGRQAEVIEDMLNAVLANDGRKK